MPFLDVEFLDVAMRMDATAKVVGTRADGTRRIEKAVLRAAFAGYLPNEILWRQKEQFSDGVGYGWIDGLKVHAAAQVSEREMATAANRFPLNPPQSREAYFYRRIFERLFPGEACAQTVPGGKSIACSSPAAIAWDAAFADAGARGGARTSFQVSDGPVTPGRRIGLTTSTTQSHRTPCTSTSGSRPYRWPAGH